MCRAFGSIVLCCSIALPISAGEVVLAKAVGAVRAERAATGTTPAEAGEEPRAGSLRSLQAAAMNSPGTLFFLPIFEVDTESELTTLFAARNLEEVQEFVTASYFDRSGSFIKNESFLLDPREVITRNLQDVTGLPVEPDGVRRGFLFVTGGSMTGDFFRVDSGSDFASGDRLVVASTPYLCNAWELRFLRGGAFSGGTDMVIVVDTPLGDDHLADPHSVEIDVYDEAGGFLATAFLWTDLMVNKVSASQVLAAIGEPGINFGVFEVFFTPLTEGGLVQSTYSAEGRYSIGMHATCT